MTKIEIVSIIAGTMVVIGGLISPRLFILKAVRVQRQKKHLQIMDFVILFAPAYLGIMLGAFVIILSLTRII